MTNGPGNPDRKGQAFLLLDRLVKRFGEVTAVDEVSLALPRGEIFALLGSSGCGKSTLLRMLAGFESPSSGRIVLEGEDITALRPHQRPINMMFQSYALFPHLSAWDNIAFGLRRHGWKREEVAARVERMLALVQLGPQARRKPHQLSGGQQQRVALARSLALEPRLLLLDEPLGALDRKLRAQTQFELQAIIREVGVTCLIVTHDQEEAMTLADRMAVMSAGRLLQVGTPRDVYEMPANRFVADFIGNINIFEGTLAEDHPDHCVVATPQGSIRVGHGITGIEGQAIAVAVRPEKVRLVAAGAPGAAPAAGNALPGRIAEAAYFGSHSGYRVELAGGMRLQVTVPNADRHGDALPAGAAVLACFDDDALVVLAD